MCTGYWAVLYVNRILGCIYMLVRNIDLAHDGTDLEAESLGT